MKNQLENNSNFQKMNDHALIMRYNQELGNSGWTSSRAVFFNALQAEFKERGIDCKAISNDGIGLKLSKECEAFIFGKKVMLKKDFPLANASIEIQFKDERPNHKEKCYFKRIVAHSINLFQLLEETNKTILLSFEHEHLQTTIDGTGIHNYLMAAFDENNNLIGVSFFNQIGTGTFAIQTQAKSVLIFHQDQFEFHEFEIASLELVF
jgi:hypothetical protein